MRRFVMEANDYMRMVEKGQKWPEEINDWKLQGVTIEFVQPDAAPDKPTVMPEWLSRQFDNAEATVADWPEWKKIAAGIPPNPLPQ